MLVAEVRSLSELATDARNLLDDAKRLRQGRTDERDLGTSLPIPNLRELLAGLGYRLGSLVTAAQAA